MHTVRDLITALLKFDLDAPVALGGSDFLYTWNGRIEEIASGTVVLEPGGYAE